jgi:hypothetical protein
MRAALRPALVAALAVPAALSGADRTLPITLFPGVSSGAPDPRFQALIVGGAWPTLAPARRASARNWLGAVATWLRPEGLPVFSDARFAVLPRPDPRPRGGVEDEAAAIVAPIAIRHSDVGCVVAEAYPRLSACVTPSDRLGRAQVFFRPEGTEAWYAVDMEPNGECLSAVLPKPKASLAGFEYYVGAIDTSFDEVAEPSTAPDAVFTARVVRSPGDCDKDRRIAAAVLKMAAPLAVESLTGSPVPAGFSADGVAVGAPAGVNVSLVATGASSGDVLQLQAVNESGAPVRVALSPGLVVVPAGKGRMEPAAAKAKGGVQTASIRGFCLDFEKPPPPPGTIYRIADASLAQRFHALSRVVQAGDRLARSGGLHPDSDPRAYADSIKQWALWARLAGWSAPEFANAFVGRTRKNVEEMKRAWTPEMESAVRAAAPGRWSDIDRVLGAADASPRPSPAPR